MQDDPGVMLIPRKSEALWLILGSLAFVAAGIWMIQTQGWIGYLIAGFFALGVLMGVVQ